MQGIMVLVGDKVFEFNDFEDWCDTAKIKFKNAGLRGENAVCVDTHGRICLSGKEFGRARDQGAWPVEVFEARCG